MLTTPRDELLETVYIPPGGLRSTVEGYVANMFSQLIERASITQAPLSQLRGTNKARMRLK